MGDFTVLPVYGGAGDWHFNRYRVVFMRPPNIVQATPRERFRHQFSAVSDEQIREGRENGQDLRNDADVSLSWLSK